MGPAPEPDRQRALSGAILGGHAAAVDGGRVGSDDRDGIEVLSDFHRQVDTHLDLLDDLAQEAREHGRVGKARAEVIARFFGNALVEHDTDEETLLLPLLRQYSDDPMLVRLVTVCTNGHEKLEARVEALIPVLWTLAKHPDHVDGELLASKTRGLRSLLEGHMRLEESTLFPHARDVLSSEELRGLGNELRTLAEERRLGTKRVKKL